LYSDPNEQQARWAAVEEVVNALGAYEKGTKKPTLGGFIDEVTLGQQDLGDEKEKQLAKNAVALMTLHSAKGLEFPPVYMVGLDRAECQGRSRAGRRNAICLPAPRQPFPPLASRGGYCRS